MPADGRTPCSGDSRAPCTSVSGTPLRSSISWPSDSSPRLRGEGHAEQFKKLLGLLVGLRRRHDADLQPAETVHLVVVDLREGELLPKPERIIAAPVERPARDAPEVADTRQRQHRQPVHEVPHPLAAEGDLGPDRVARPYAELGDRALGLGHDRLLAGDEAHVAEGGVERLRVAQRLAEPDVDHDLRQSRHFHRVGIGELLLERGDDLRRVALLESAGHAFPSICSPQWRQTRTRRPVSSVAWAIRVGLPQLEQTNMTRLIGSGCGRSRMPPCWILGTRSLVPADWRGFVWRFAMLSPSTTTLTPPAADPRRKTLLAELGEAWRRITRSTVPRLPASLPASTTTVSPVRISGTFGVRGWRVRAAITAPPARVTRSSCSCDRAARGRPARRW